MATMQDSNQGKLIDEAIVQLVILDLPVIGSSWSWRESPFIKDPATQCPCGVVNATPERMNAREGTNGKADIHYRLLLSFYVLGQSLTENLPEKLGWREAVRQHFHLTPALAATGLEILEVRVEHAPIVVPPALAKLVNCMYLILDVRVREALQL